MSRSIKLRAWHDPNYGDDYKMDYDPKIYNEPGIGLNSMVESYDSYTLMQYTGKKTPRATVSTMRI